jgi:hypothetical protein
MKYAEELGRMANCPPSMASPCARKAVRFVFDSIEDRRNFMPVATLTPQRTFKEAAGRCDSYALSFFETVTQARKKYMELKRANKNLYRKIGPMIAEGVISETDGVASQPNGQGHFSPWESATAGFVTTFTITGACVP